MPARRGPARNLWLGRFRSARCFMTPFKTWPRLTLSPAIKPWKTSQYQQVSTCISSWFISLSTHREYQVRDWCHHFISISSAWLVTINSYQPLHHGGWWRWSPKGVPSRVNLTTNHSRGLKLTTKLGGSPTIPMRAPYLDVQRFVKPWLHPNSPVANEPQTKPAGNCDHWPAEPRANPAVRLVRLIALLVDGKTGYCLLWLILSMIVGNGWLLVDFMAGFIGCWFIACCGHQPTAGTREQGTNLRMFMRVFGPVIACTSAALCHGGQCWTMWWAGSWPTQNGW